MGTTTNFSGYLTDPYTMKKCMDEALERVDPQEFMFSRIDITVRRNDPCVCGSGKKFKRCCGRDA